MPPSKYAPANRLRCALSRALFRRTINRRITSDENVDSLISPFFTFTLTPYRRLVYRLRASAW